MKSHYETVAPMVMPSDLPSRFCVRVVAESNSRVLLDVSSAENLLGKGDMLFLQPGTSAPVRGQGVWLKDSEISVIIEHTKAQGSPTYDDEVLTVGAVQMEGGGGSGSSGSDWIPDRQFHEAVQSMYRCNRSGADFFRRSSTSATTRPPPTSSSSRTSASSARRRAPQLARSSSHGTTGSRASRATG
jgi:DNA segregation ATPase FtsK/SpoIIIE-like protein